MSEKLRQQISASPESRKRSVERSNLAIPNRVQKSRADTVLFADDELDLFEMLEPQLALGFRSEVWRPKICGKALKDSTGQLKIFVQVSHIQADIPQQAGRERYHTGFDLSEDFPSRRVLFSQCTFAL